MKKGAVYRILVLGSLFGRWQFDYLRLWWGSLISQSLVYNLQGLASDQVRLDNFNL